MTAGRSAGTEQGQGPECDHVQHSVANAITGEAVCQRCGLHWQFVPLSSVPPARDSGRDEAERRAEEAMARALVDGLSTFAEAFASCYENAPEINWREAAELFVNDSEVPQQLLSLPAVAALLRDGTRT